MIERLIETCAKNRILVFIGVAVALAGAFLAISRIKLDAIPDLSDPQVIIATEWMGRSPTLVEDQITYPIAAKLLGAPKVTDVRGYSMFGMSFVYVLFEDGTDPYWARSRVLEYLSGLGKSLPEGVSPALGPDATGIGWVFQYTLTDKSGKNRLDELRALQDFTLKYALGAVPGVAEVASVGGYEKQYQVTLDPARLKAYGITLDQVASAIRESNSDVGGRLIEMSAREYYVRGRGYIENLDQLEQVAIKASGPNGTPVLLRDLGTLRFGPEMRRGLLEWNGEGEAVGGIVVMRHGENALQVIERVKAKIAELKPGLPEGVEIAVAYDRSDLIHRSIDTLKHSLLEEAIVVSLVILLFLLHFRSALLPILSLPVSVALSFIPMALFDIPSTIMSLGGIAIAIGATVDAEIVMVEASHKALEHAPPGADRRALLAKAAREVTPAIFFSLLIIAVAFLPVFTLNGQAGRLFRPLAYTKTFVMLFAALVSITFAPALRDLLIRGKIRTEKEHPISRFIIRLYKPFVFVALRSPRSTLLIGLFAILSAIPIAGKLGHEFMPPLNEGDILYMPTTFPNMSIEEAKRQLQAQDRVLKSFPEVEAVFGKSGRAETATDPAPLTMVETAVKLKPPEQWRMLHHDRWYSGLRPAFLKRPLQLFWPEETRITWEELTSEMNRAMQFPGWTNAWTLPIKTRIDMLSTGIRTPVGVKIFGNDLHAIEEAGIALERILSPVEGTRSVFYERNLGGLYVDIIPNREALARYGLKVGDIQRVIDTAIGGSPITTTLEGRKRFTISLRYPSDLRDNLDSLKQLLVPVGGAGGGGKDGMGGLLLLDPDRAYAMGPSMGGGGSATSPSTSPSLAPGNSAPILDASPLGAMGAPMGSGGMGQRPMGGGDSGFPGAAPKGDSIRYIPLGMLADIRIANGPPMVRDEDGFLVGYVYIDIDQAQYDVGGYVQRAKAVVASALAQNELTLPHGSFLKWTGQYELMEEMHARMRLVIPATLALIILLLYLHFKNAIEVLIVLLSVPFALVGSVWLLWALDYRISTAVWVGVIALVGLAAQTGIVMIVYIDNAFHRRKEKGLIRDLNDIIWAHMEGTVMRVRPKLMTVSTMLAGLIPLLWATGSGADVMRRVAAPMVGGLLTSAFLTLEIIPVIYTYWRQEELLWERLSPLDPERLLQLKRWAYTLAAAASLLVAVLILPIYLPVPRGLWISLLAFPLVAMAYATFRYLTGRSGAMRQVWP